MTEADIQALILQHQGLVSSGIVKGTETIKDPTDNTKVPNPNPTYHYVFKDGSSIDAVKKADGTYSIVGSGAALKPAAPASTEPVTIPTNTTDQYIVTRNPNGSYTNVPNPNYVAPADAAAKPPVEASANTSNQFIVQILADGTIKQIPNPNYVKPKEAVPTEVSAGANTQYIVQMRPDGTLTTTPNPNYVPPDKTAAAADAARVKIEQQNADTAAASQAATAAHYTASDALAQAQQMQKEGQDAIANAHLNGQLSLDQAKEAATELNNRIQNFLTQRGQDISSANTQRGQDMTFASNLADTGTQAAISALSHEAPAGTTAAINDAYNQAQSGGPISVHLPSARIPFEPTSLPMQLAAQALAHISPSAAQIAGKPVPDTTQGYQAPGQAPTAPFVPSYNESPVPAQAAAIPQFQAPSLGAATR